MIRQGMSKPRRFMVLGIDGMDPEIFRFLHQKGKMPVLGAIGLKLQISSHIQPSSEPCFMDKYS
jgi:hypothetical protein